MLQDCPFFSQNDTLASLSVHCPLSKKVRLDIYGDTWLLLNYKEKSSQYILHFSSKTQLGFVQDYLIVLYKQLIVRSKTDRGSGVDRCHEHEGAAGCSAQGGTYIL